MSGSRGGEEGDLSGSREAWHMECCAAGTGFQDRTMFSALRNLSSSVALHPVAGRIAGKISTR